MNDSFDALRLRLETGRKFPLTICIASATARDGAAQVAYGLSSAFAASGTRTLAVLENESAQILERAAPVVDSLAGIIKGGVVAQPNGVETTFLRARGAPERQSEMHESLRVLLFDYQAIVFEASAAAVRSTMLQRATLADIAVIAVRLGRPKMAEDRALMERLRALSVPVLGVVSSPRSAANVGRRWSSAPAPDSAVAPGRT